MLNVNRTIARRFSRIGIVIPVLAIVMFAAGTASAQPVKTEFPFSYNDLINPCVTTESVDISGTANLFLYSKGDSLTFRIKQFGSGISNTGASYSFHAEESTKLTNVSSGTLETTLLTKVHLIRQGEIGPGTPDDFLSKIVIHVTFNSNGTMTANHLSMALECPGAGNP